MLGFFYAQKQVIAMKDRITVFSIYITIKIPLRFFAFRHPVVAQLKAEVNGKNCTPLRFVAFALCARLLLKTLIIPRVRLAIEFGSFLFTQQFCPFSLTSGIATLTRTYVCFSRCYPVFAERLIKNGGIKCCI